MTGRDILLVVAAVMGAIGIVLAGFASRAPARPAACRTPAAYTDAGLRACYDASTGYGITP